MANVRSVVLLYLVASLGGIMQPANAIIGQVESVIALTKEAKSILLDIWDHIENKDAVNKVDIPFHEVQEKKILSRISSLARELNTAAASSSSRVTWAINNINQNMNTNTQLQLQLRDLSAMIDRVNSQQNRMYSYALHLKHLEQDTLIRYAQQTLSPDDGAIQGLLERIHFLIAGRDELQSLGAIGLLELVADNMQESQNQVCSMRQSAQQVLYQLYVSVSLTELRGYSMMQFSWMLLKTYGIGNYTKESELMLQSFEQRAAKTQALLRKVMERADRQVWRCDPAQHVEGETFVTVTRLLQGYIENEINMNADGSCTRNCGYYALSDYYGCYHDNQYCSDQPKCAGKILNCQYIDAHMSICPAESSRSERRYEYIEYENGQTLGQKATCTRGTTNVRSWWSWVINHCSYCLCMCDEEGLKSDRYFSLREEVSNVSANRVVTGLRFRKINRVVYLQIQEGRLAKRGLVDATTVQWRPVNAFRLLDYSNVFWNVDYHSLAWSRRAIDTDDLMAPANHVVTGVRFRIVGTHLNLEIRVTEADFVTGELLGPSHWHSSDSKNTSDMHRTQMHLIQPDVPTRTHSKSVPTTLSNQYVEFGPTDIDADLGQTTVPYLDSQDVTSLPAVALAGAGLFHKGQMGYGGFVAPKLITYDFAPHIAIASETEMEMASLSSGRDD